MITITKLSKSFGDLKVLDNINLKIDDGQIYGLVGESGQGKSTLLRCVNGLIPYNGGSLKVDDVEVSSKKGKELRQFRKTMGMIFQNFSLLERMTVYDNIAFPMRLWKFEESKIASQVSKMMEIVNLSDKAEYFPRSLSGGQKQRVAIARALVMNPKYLLSDEATSALDPRTGKAILELLKQINQQLGITVLLVTHQMNVVQETCDKMALLKNGHIEVDGDVKSIFLDPPKTMRQLMGQQDTIIPLGTKCFRICVEEDKYQKFLVNISSYLGMPCGLIEGGITQFKYGKCLMGTISVPQESYYDTIKYLKGQDIQFQEINNEI
ncbi:methionine ABC transporter ATP-binding protein [Aedoeadaptatus coxii]|uniref:methionine ABC transporter ATP-binding protein n=1 Tax=Aedoeadaptatus coxii TaxID=755172 RepID=UPI002AD5AEB0|nr:methionine ABC transporter ATP-binding protein [Peptoniphilus coxii]